MGFLQTAVDAVNTYLSDYILVVVLILAGVFFTVRTRFVQVRCFGEGMRAVFGNFSMNGKNAGGGFSSFQALSTAIAGQVGTGNIVGVCGALLVGGPGAIFWMWVIAFFGMATIYAEAVLAVQTREKTENGDVVGGPAVYIRRAFKGRTGKILASLFAVSCILALGMMGAMVQSNSIAGTCNTAFGIPVWVTGIVVALFALFVFLGGEKWVASVVEKIVPIMAVLYILGALVVIALRVRYVPESFAMIFRYAFRPDAIIGGGIGMALKTAISQGAKRGLFSNEAGMGSTPHAHAMANVKTAHEQGVVAMIGVFLDTFVVLNLTALVTISTLYAGGGPLSSGATEGFAKDNMAQRAFSMVFGETAGSAFVAVCLFFFAFSTILGWNFFGRLNIRYLFRSRKAVTVYSLIAGVMVFLGAVVASDLVWGLADLFNQLMVLFNVPALLVFSAMIVLMAKTRGKGSDLPPPL